MNLSVRCIVAFAAVLSLGLSGVAGPGWAQEEPQADPLQDCQGFFLEQHPRTALQELIRKTNFFGYRWKADHCNGWD